MGVSKSVIGDAGRHGAAWYLWPNILSVDAPLVAVCWQVLLARSLGVSDSVPVTVALGAAVWCIYVLDRLFDGPAEGTARHRFHWDHRISLLVAVAAAAMATVAFAMPKLPPPVLGRGFGLALVCGVYLWAAQCFCSEKEWKSCAIAVVFASGVGLPFSGGGAIWAIGAMTAVVWVNSRLIGLWEAGFTEVAWIRVGIFVVGAVLMAVGGRFYAALGLSFWWMLVLDAGAGWRGARAARPFVDLGLALIAIVCLR